MREHSKGQQLVPFFCMQHLQAPLHPVWIMPKRLSVRKTNVMTSYCPGSCSNPARWVCKSIFGFQANITKRNFYPVPGVSQYNQPFGILGQTVSSLVGVTRGPKNLMYTGLVKKSLLDVPVHVLLNSTNSPHILYLAVTSKNLWSASIKISMKLGKQEHIYTCMLFNSSSFFFPFIVYITPKILLILKRNTKNKHFKLEIWPQRPMYLAATITIHHSGRGVALSMGGWCFS